MTSDSSWRSLVGFTDRLNNIGAIIQAYQTANPGCDFPTAQLEATKIEEKALEDTSSKEDYQRSCEKVINDLQREVTSHIEHVQLAGLTSDANSHFNDEASFCLPPKAIGPYKHAYYYREGLFSVVYRSKKPNGDRVALKVTSPHLMQPPHNSEREARILQSLRHENIITLHKTFREVGGHFVLEFPFMRHQFDELLQQRALSKKQVKECLRGLFSGLEYLHANGIIHRDVKPSNLLLNGLDGPVCLSDFGIAWSPSDPASEPADNKITDVGTTSYRPVEILFGDTAYDFSLDMWAAGCVAAEALAVSHEKLFDAGPLGSELGLIKSIFTTLGTPDEKVWPSARRMPDWGKFQFQEYPAKSWSEILPGTTEEARDLVGRLVCYEQTARLSASEALRHKFFAS